MSSESSENSETDSEYSAPLRPLDSANADQRNLSAEADSDDSMDRLFENFPDLTLLETEAVNSQEPDSSDPPTLTSFTLFPDLPLELRLKIWQFSYPGARVVEHCQGDRRRNGSQFYSSDQIQTARPPALLHVNQEARREALKNYELVPLWELLGARTLNSSYKQKIYFNFEVDTLYFSEATFRTRDPFSDIEDTYEAYGRISVEQNEAQTPRTLPRVRVKNIAIDSHAVYGNSYHPYLAYEEIVGAFPNLETLTVVRDWTTWNLPDWQIWWSLSRGFQKHQALPEAEYLCGLSMKERCVHESFVLCGLERDQAAFYNDKLPGENSKRPIIKLMAYFGTGEYVPPNGDAIIEGYQGPAREPSLHGAELELLPISIQTILHDLLVQEGFAYYMTTWFYIRGYLSFLSNGRWIFPLRNPSL